MMILLGEESRGAYGRLWLPQIAQIAAEWHQQKLAVSATSNIREYYSLYSFEEHNP